MAYAYTSQVVTITPGEAADLRQLEARIRAGLATFVDVGMALLEIRDRRLYRATYLDFGSYCVHEWKMTRQHATRLANAAEVAGNLASPSPCNQLVTPTKTTKNTAKSATGPQPTPQPTSEYQVRPLVGLPADRQREVWQAATVAADGEPTSTLVERFRNAGVDGASLLKLAQKEREELRAHAASIAERGKPADPAAADRQRLAKIEQLANRLRKLIEGLGDKAKPAARHLAKAIEAIETIQKPL